MFYKYEIINNGNGDILYLYLNTKYEFAKDFQQIDDINILNNTNEFIQKNGIKFSGKKIYYVVDGIIVKKLNVNNSNSIDSDFSVDNYIVIIRLEDNSLCEINLREFLLSILFGNYINPLHDEVLKAITILYITYAYKMMKENSFISCSNDFLSYKPLSYYKDNISCFDKLYNRFNFIIDEVNGIFIKYDNNYILPFIHYSNIGKTLKNDKYPYLSSVKSLWDITSPYFIDYKDYSYKDISKLLNIKVSFKDKFDIESYENSKRIIIGNYTFTSEEFKKILCLNSNDIYLIVNKKYLRVVTMGYGNSYGLSLFGSNMIAYDGGKYFDILKYYFPKVKIYRYIKELL